MKKVVVVGLLVTAALAVVATGVAFAQEPQPPMPAEVAWVPAEAWVRCALSPMAKRALCTSTW